ncbi:hypothetical protein K8Q93_00750 [Candidatus Parcubacteria bacterium]|nr:hypothetical protein [Candidatus Parcubacteria bacterium]
MNHTDPSADVPAASVFSVILARLPLALLSLLFGLMSAPLLRAQIDSLTSCRLLAPHSGACEPEVVFFSWLALVSLILGTSYCLAWVISRLRFLSAFKARAALEGAPFREIASCFAALGLSLYYFWAAVELSFSTSLFPLALVLVGIFVLTLDFLKEWAYCRTGIKH